MKIIEKIHPDILKKAVGRARERGVVLPTFAQQKDPSMVPAKIVARLKNLGLWDVDPANLFRITWHNEPKARGGGFGGGGSHASGAALLCDGRHPLCGGG